MQREGSTPPELEAMHQRIRAYRDNLTLLGLKDYQVPSSLTSGGPWHAVLTGPSTDAKEVATYSARS